MNTIKNIKKTGFINWFFAQFYKILKLIHLFLKLVDRIVPVRAIFSVFDHTSFISVVSLLSIFLIFSSSQISDFLRIYSEWGKYFIGFTALELIILLWSITIWFSMRVIYSSYNIKQLAYPKATEFLANYIPRFLGVVPLIIFAAVFYRIGNGFGVIVNIILAFILILFYRYRTLLLRYITKNDKFQYLKIYINNNRFGTDTMGFKNIIRKPFNLIFILILVILNLFMFSEFLWSNDVKIWFSQHFSPLIIVIIAIICFTISGIFVDGFSNKYHMPTVLLLIIIAVIFSNFNNNHQIRTLPLAKERPNFDTYFSNYIKDNQQYFNTSDTIPLFIIASEGGGIRSLVWTTEMLMGLQQKYPHFKNHIVAMSGVSGGNVGEVFTKAYFNENFKSKYDNSTKFKDYITNILIRLFYADFLQRFLPLGIPAFDRARALEDRFSYDFYHNNENILDSGYLSDFYGKYPAMLMNSVHAETGRKAIFSNFELDSSLFCDVLDVFKYHKNDIPVKTVASICSRFPILTPPAKIEFNNSYGNFVDGGYYENTGLETAVQVYRCIQKYIEIHSKNINLQYTLHRIKPIIVFIQNSNESLNENPIKMGYELKSISSAFLGAWDRSGVARSGNYRNSLLNQPNVDFVKFKLERQGKVTLPLGWYLSEEALEVIKNQSSSLINETQVTKNIDMLKINAYLQKTNRP